MVIIRKPAAGYGHQGCDIKMSQGFHNFFILKFPDFYSYYLTPKYRNFATFLDFYLVSEQPDEFDALRAF